MGNRVKAVLAVCFIFSLLAFQMVQSGWTQNAFASSTVEPVEISVSELHINDHGVLIWTQENGEETPIRFYPAIPDGQTGAGEKYWFAGEEGLETDVDPITDIELSDTTLYVGGEAVTMYHMPEEMIRNEHFDSWAAFQTEVSLEEWSDWASQAGYDELLSWSSFAWNSEAWTDQVYGFSYDDFLSWSQYMKDLSAGFNTWARGLSVEEAEEWVSWAAEASEEELDEFKEWIKPCPSHAVCGVFSWAPWAKFQSENSLADWVSWIQNTAPRAVLADWIHWNIVPTGPMGYYE